MAVARPGPLAGSEMAVADAMKEVEPAPVARSSCAPASAASSLSTSSSADGRERVSALATSASGKVCGFAFSALAVAFFHQAYTDAVSDLSTCLPNQISWKLPLGLVCSYLLYVAVALWRGNVFPLPKAFVDGLMFSYNLFQIFFNSAWCLFVVLHLLRVGQPIVGAQFDASTCQDRQGNYKLQGAGGLGGGDNVNERELEGPPTLAFLLWLHYVNKPIEFLDTFFMVQRDKADKQLSFLHVYHHALMVFAWYEVVQHFPGGDAWFGAWVNSLIHVLMYSYYFVASLRWFTIPAVVKKTMTRLQMLQFCVCFGHAVYVSDLGSGSVPNWLCLLQIYVMVNMLLLFGNFYRGAYRGGGKTGVSTPAAEKPPKKLE
eukprot:g1887.t1